MRYAFLGVEVNHEQQGAEKGNVKYPDNEIKKYELSQLDLFCFVQDS